MSTIAIIRDNLVHKYFDLNSRTNIQEYWIVMSVLATCALAVLWMSFSGASSILLSVLSILFFIPSQTLAVRRFNDVGLSKSDYFIFAFVISLCSFAAYLFHMNGYIFSMAVVLWFLFGSVVALFIQFCRSSK